MQKNPANSSDYYPIAIYFCDLEISYLFAELIESQGYKAEIVDSVEDATKETHIITEPAIFDRLPNWSKAQCLVVGDVNTTKNGQATYLLRPLSEEKIETALYTFLPPK